MGIGAAVVGCIGIAAVWGCAGCICMGCGGCCCNCCMGSGPDRKWPGRAFGAGIAGAMPEIIAGSGLLATGAGAEETGFSNPSFGLLGMSGTVMTSLHHLFSMPLERNGRRDLGAAQLQKTPRNTSFNGLLLEESYERKHSSTLRSSGGCRS